MKIGIIGTGTVGQTLAEKLNKMGHSVVIGTRNVEEKLSSENPDQYGNPPFSQWQQANSNIPLVNFGEAAEYGDIIINATKGSASIYALHEAGENNLRNKILIDVANPLDMSKGMPPSLIPELSNTHSLGEEIQQKFPDSKVVKTFNTMWAGIMVNPQTVNNGDHTNFICGNDASAKQEVKNLLIEMGWKADCIIDIGDISSARGTESFLPVWLRIMNAKQSAAFNLKIVE